MNKRQRCYSSYYHDYFEDHVEIVKRTPDGKSHIERVYVGYYYRHAFSSKRWLFTKALYALLYAFSAAVFLHAASQRIAANMVWYVQIFEFLSVIFLLLTLYTLAMYEIAPRRMTVWEYRTGSKRLVLFGGAAAGSMMGAGGAAWVYAAICRESAEAGFSAGACMILSGAAIMAVAVMERGMKYERLKQEGVPTPNGLRIW